MNIKRSKCLIKRPHKTSRDSTSLWTLKSVNSFDNAACYEHLIVVRAKRRRKDDKNKEFDKIGYKVVGFVRSAVSEQRDVEARTLN